MSGDPAIVTPPRRLVSPVAFQKDQNGAVVLNGKPGQENSHSLGIASDTSTPSTIAMPKIDSCILGIETQEQTERFTVSSITGYFDIAFGLQRLSFHDNLTLCWLSPISCTRLRSTMARNPGLFTGDMGSLCS